MYWQRHLRSASLSDLLSHGCTHITDKTETHVHVFLTLLLHHGAKMSILPLVFLLVDNDGIIWFNLEGCFY